MKKKIIIIGGGIAGLSAGIYSAMNGFDTEIIEMHNVAGGQCTAWERKKYRFDYCLHWLVGTSKGAFHEIWKETNVINNETEIIDHEVFSQIFDKDRNEFIIYTNIERWEKYLIGMATEDTKPIHRMCNDMRKSALLEPFALPPELRNPLDYIRIIPAMLPVFNLVRKFGRLTCKEYFDKLNFKNEKIKSFLHELYGERNFSALMFIFMLGWFNQKNAGYIKGGSFPLAQRMVEKFEILGGRISYKKKVEKISVENHIARGVILTDGTKISSDYVISASDGYTTIYKMLEGKYISKKIDFAYKNWELFTPIVQVSFGINKVIKYASPIIINLSKDLKIGRTQLEHGYSIMGTSKNSVIIASKAKQSLFLHHKWGLLRSFLTRNDIILSF